jgi:hypothetical protein
MMGHGHIDPAARHAEICRDRLAEHAARLAFLEARLELTEAQKPLFNKWRQAVLDNAAKEKATCLGLAPKAGTPPTIVEREAQEQTILSQKLQGLQSSHAALQALYDSLTASQRQILDHPHRHGHHEDEGGWGMMHGGFGPMEPR